MKNKDHQRLLKFPSMINLEPGGKSELKPVPDPDQPEWKRDLLQKVEEHRKKKELQQNLQQIRNLEGNGSQPEGRTAGGREASARPGTGHGTEEQEPDGQFEFSGKSLLESLLPVLPPPPHPPQAGPVISEEVRERLEVTHRQLFRDLEATPAVEAPVEELPDESALPGDGPGSPEEPPVLSFDEIDLTRTAQSNAVLLESSSPALSPAFSQEEMLLPMEEVIRRRKERQRAQKPARADRTILISRFLAGLIDLIVTLLCSLLMMLMASFTSRTSLFSLTTVWTFLPVFLTIHFAYSYYFLFLMERTPGMLAVGLQVTSCRKTHLTAGAILVRTAVFAASIACLGLGLFWGIFDRESKCWQDILSDTCIVRAD